MNFIILLWVFIPSIICRNVQDFSANKDGNLQLPEALDSPVEQSRVADMLPELLYGLHKEASEIGETLGERLSYGLDESSWHTFINHPSANPENVMLQDYMNKMYRIFGKAASVLSGHGVQKRETQKTLNESQVLFNWFFEQFGDPTVQRFTEIMDSEQLDQATQPPPQNDGDVVFVGERSYDISHRLANPSPSSAEDYRGQKVEYEIGNVGTHLYQRKVKYNRKIERKFEGLNQYKGGNPFEKVYEESLKYSPTSKKTYEKDVKVESSPQLGYRVEMNQMVENSGDEDNMIDIGVQKEIEDFRKYADEVRRNHVKELSEIHANIGNSIDEDNLTLRKREEAAKKLSDKVDSVTSMPDMSLGTDNTVGDEGVQSFGSFPLHSSDLSVGDRSLLLRNFKAALGKMTFAEETLCNFANCSHILGNVGEKSIEENMVADEAHSSTTDTVESSSQANLQKDLNSVAEIATLEDENEGLKRPKAFVSGNFLVIENMVADDEHLSTTESSQVNLHRDDLTSTMADSKDGSTLKDENDVETQPMDSVSAVIDVKSLSRSPDRSRRATPSVVPNVNKDSSDVTSPNYGPELEEDDYNLMDDKIEFVAYATVTSLLVICLLLAYWLIVYKRQQRTRKYDPNSTTDA